jgi:hypothetical protein
MAAHAPPEADGGADCWVSNSVSTTTRCWKAEAPLVQRKIRGMIARPISAGTVAAFLKDVLGAGGIGVTELEILARAAGLLDAHQRITHAKLFKSAKKELGIRSVRNGFGTAGQWQWLLDKQKSPRVTETSAQRMDGAGAPAIEDTYEEQGATKGVLASFGIRRAPLSWVDGVARLDYHCPFSDIPAHRWRQFLSDCNNFLSSDENWAERAAQLGWDAPALFGCRPGHALSQLGSSGLMWVINGGRLVELHRDWALYELAGTGSRRSFERRRSDAGKVTLPWIRADQRSGDN